MSDTDAISLVLENQRVIFKCMSALLSHDDAMRYNTARMELAQADVSTRNALVRRNRNIASDR